MDIGGDRGELLLEAFFAHDTAAKPLTDADDGDGSRTVEELGQAVGGKFGAGLLIRRDIGEERAGGWAELIVDHHHRTMLVDLLHDQAAVGDGFVGDKDESL